MGWIRDGLITGSGLGYGCYDNGRVWYMAFRLKLGLIPLLNLEAGVIRVD